MGDKSGWVAHLLAILVCTRTAPDKCPLVSLEPQHLLTVEL